MSCHIGWALVVLVAAWSAGCGGGTDPELENRPKTVPAGGTLTYNGKPIEGATVTFTLQDGSRSAFATTDAEGAFALTTFDSGDGAVPGAYTVKVTKFEAPPTTGSTDEANYVPPEATKTKAAPPKSLIPEKYGNPATSGLTATVTEEGENQFPLALTD